MADKAYFRKEFPKIKVRLASGKIPEWELVARELGVIASTGKEVDELEAVVGKFGVTKITKSEYDELKKNSPIALAPKPEWKPSLTGEPPQRKPSGRKSKASSQAAVAKPAPAANEPELLTEQPQTQTGAVE